MGRTRPADQEAFSELVTRYQVALENILVPMVRSREQARDLVQETILKASRNLHRYREGHRFSTWFFRIGINLAISARRRSDLEKRVLGEGRLAAGKPQVSESPLDALVRQEEAARITGALRRLPERYRRVLEMRYGEEMSCKDIAGVLKSTPNSVSIILFRAKQKLREDLDA